MLRAEIFSWVDPTAYWAGPEASKKDRKNGEVAFIPVYFGY